MLPIEQLPNCIRNDPEWLAWARIVAALTTQDDVKFGCNHDIQHWVTVSNTAKDFTTLAGGSHHEVQLAIIAGLLHDCGLICGEKHHAANGAQIAKAFLEARYYGNNAPLSDNDIALICHAIANHGDGKETKSIIDAAIIFADKIHVTKDRVVTASSIILEEAIKIEHVSYSIDADTLTLRYQVSDGFRPEQFFRWQKAYDAPAKAAAFIGKAFVLLINGKRFNLPI